MGVSEVIDLDHGDDQVSEHAKERPGLDIGSLGRTAVIAGAGVRNAGAIKEFEAFIGKHYLPFLVSFGGVDLLPVHPLRLGVIGTHGNQAAWDALPQFDTLLAIGTRLSLNTRGYNEELLKGKRVIVVDIDPSEHEGRELIQEDLKEWLCRHTN